MDFVTSVTAAKTGHTASPGRGGSEADRDASAQIPAFEEEIATLRDLAVEAHSSGDEAIPTAKPGLTGDVQAEADVVIDPAAAAALDSSDFDAAVADVTERLGRDAAGEFVSKGGVSAEEILPLSDVFPQTVSVVSQASTQTPSQALEAADVNSVPAPSAGASAVETPKTGTGEARDPASHSAVVRADTSFASANSASGAGSTRADLPAAATVVRAEDAPTSPLSGQLSAAGVRGATSEQVALATSQRASGEGGADQTMTASKSEFATRASAGPGYMAPVVPRGVPSAATSVPDELPPGSLPTETALRSVAAGTGAGPQTAAAQMLASRDGRSDARGTVGPQSIWPRENGLDGVPIRSSSSAQSALGVESATQTSGSPLPPALSGNAAQSQAFVPATPAMAPLFASPGGTVREGTGDATFLGADLAALDTGRAQSGAFPSATALPAEPRAIVRQIADAMIAAHENGIDLQLSPEELGRVKLSITPGEGGFLVTVSADRPETLELLRRHIDLLGEEFAALGLGDTAFSFNDPPGHPAQDDEHRSQTDAALVGLGETAEPDTAVPPAPHPRAQSGLLDIRL